jgi:hypothetical protein
MWIVLIRYEGRKAETNIKIGVYVVFKQIVALKETIIKKCLSHNMMLLSEAIPLAGLGGL